MKYFFLYVNLWQGESSSSLSIRFVILNIKKIPIPGDVLMFSVVLNSSNTIRKKNAFNQWSQAFISNQKVSKILLRSNKGLLAF